ncbi:MAG TPA: TonB-dependent receptor [Povalibacter sp.]|nr:TonB-dependent receptor [Povalibacter sp.]
MTINERSTCVREQGALAVAVRRALGCAYVTVLSMTAPLAVGTAMAQEQAASDVLQEITVTGTRIVRDGYEAPTPVSVLGMEQLSEMATTNLADSVNRLPALAGSVSSHNMSGNVSSGTAGVNNLDLRGLGATRTLVLLDGKRIVGATLAGTSNNGASVDINSIPSALVQRVEIVTGGASALYGSDALAGVVNFILDKKFTGVKASVEAGMTTYHDNDTRKFSLTGGTPFAGGNGHLLFSIENATSDEIRQNDRPWNDAGYQLINNPAYAPGNGQPQLIKTFNTGLSQATRGGLITACTMAGSTTATQNCALRGTQFIEGGQPIQFNFGPIISNPYMSGGDWERSRNDQLQSLTLDTERTTAFGRASYDVSDNTTIFTELGWSKTRAKNHHSLQTFDFGLNIKRDYAFIPDDMRQYMVDNDIESLTLGTTNVDLPPVAGDNTREFKRLMIGAEGNFDLGGINWTWDAYAARSRQEALQLAPQIRVNANYAKAVDAVRNAAGQVVCRVNDVNDPSYDAAKADPACVPYNVMGVGVNSREMVNYVTATGMAEQNLQQDVYAANVSGEPFSSWAGPVSIAIGAEHRRESVDGWASALDEATAFFAGNWHASHGKFNVTEGYLETVVPLAKNLPGAESLDFNGAVRYTDYSTSGEVTTWKLGATWSPIEDIRVRLTRSRDIRAPNLGDLFNAGQSGGSNFYDPFYDTFKVINSRTTGNPDLVPEEAETTGVGVVLTPRFIPGFALSVDYYSIDIDGAIASLGSQENINRCFQGVTQLCRFVVRDPVTNELLTVGNQPSNILQQKATGYDVEMSYSFSLSSLVSSWNGDISLRALGTYFDSLKTIDTQTTVEGAGVNADGGGIGLGTALQSPRYRYMVSATYNLDPITVSLAARGVSSGKYNNAFIDCSTDCPTATTEHPTIDGNRVPGATYYDLSFRSKLFDSGAEVFAVVENLFNEDPALVAGGRGGGFYNGQANTRYYDRLGRMYRIGLRYQF